MKVREFIQLNSESKDYFKSGLVGVSTIHCLILLDKKPNEIDLDKVNEVIDNSIMLSYPHSNSVGEVNTDGASAFLYSLYLIERKLRSVSDSINEIY